MSTERAYDNRARAAAAQMTRRRIVEAATELLLSGGYHAMSIAELAHSSGVSQQTVYNAVGGKPDVVKAVYDALLAGDHEPIPMPQRPEFAEMSLAPDRIEFVRAYGRLCGVIYDRVGPLLGVLLSGGPGADAGLRDFVATIDDERRAGNINAVKALETVHGLPPGFAVDAFLDETWSLTAPELYDRLVRRCGWSHGAYTSWLCDVLVGAFERSSGQHAAGHTSAT